ncbi:MAG TPA: alpha/beta fold hydrolase [Burkholderiaceae bacterium]
MPTLLRDNLCIDYADAGDGPPVLLLHSSVSGNRQWRKLIAGLSERFRVIAPNLRGYGATTPWTAQRKQTLPDAVQVVTALCDALSLSQPLRIVGHSFGGAVALWSAHTLGARVSHLALYEPMLPGLLRAGGRLEAAQETDLLYADVKRFSAAGDWTALAERFTDYFNGDGAWDASPPERRQAIADLLAPNPHEWDAVIEPLPADTFSGLRAQGLLMRGRKTRPALSEMSAMLHQRLRHWRMVDIAGCGHMAPLTHADAVNRWIVDFLGDGMLDDRAAVHAAPALV